MKLTEHFTLADFLRSDEAAENKIDNTPNSKQLENIRFTAQQMEKVMQILGGNVIEITSGFRTVALNKRVGGSSTSSHLTGFAVDFRCPGFGKVKAVCEALVKSGLKFDQIIYEQKSYTKWCHIGFGEQMRGQALSWKSGKGYVAGIKDL